MQFWKSVQCETSSGHLSGTRNKGMVPSRGLRVLLRQGVASQNEESSACRMTLT